MNIKIIAMGKLSEPYHKELLKESIFKFRKNNNFKFEVEVLNIKQKRLPENLSESTINKLLDEEAELILEKINSSDFLICLDILGKLIKKDLFKSIIQKLEQKNRVNIVFVIGSSYGLSKNIKKRADYLLSLGKITLNHQIVPALLLDLISEN